MTRAGKRRVASYRKDAGGEVLGRMGDANPITQAFARRFRQWRRERDLTLRQVADDLGLGTAIISEWENCNRFPSVKNLQALADYTGIPAWAFLHPGEGASAPSRHAGTGTGEAGHK